MHYPGLEEWVQNHCAIPTVTEGEDKPIPVVLQVVTGSRRSSLHVIKGRIPATGQDYRDALADVTEALRRGRNTFDRLVLVQARYKGESNAFDEFPIDAEVTGIDTTDPMSVIGVAMSYQHKTIEYLGGTLERRERTHEAVLEENANLKAELREATIMGIAKQRIAEAEGGDAATVEALRLVEPMVKLATYKMYLKMQAKKAENAERVNVTEDEQAEVCRSFSTMLETIGEMMDVYDFLPNAQHKKFIQELYAKHF